MGKYLLTLSFLLKAGNQWMYLYFRNGENFLNNSGFYTNGRNIWVQHTVEKVFVSLSDKDEAYFTTNTSNVYPFSLRNVIMTARRIDDWDVISINEFNWESDIFRQSGRVASPLSYHHVHHRHGNWAFGVWVSGHRVSGGLLIDFLE